MYKCFNLLILFTFLIISGCINPPDGNVTLQDSQPRIEPEYFDVTIPPNIAPLNFVVKEEGSAFYARFSIEDKELFDVYSKNGQIRIPEKKWRNALTQNPGKTLNTTILTKNTSGDWTEFKAFVMTIADKEIDPFLFYRILNPGYESWSEISIQQRNLESFSEISLIENSVVDQNCVNCHSFNQGKADNFLFHMRGTMGGTYFYTEEGLQKLNLKTEEMENGAVYPRWHPSGKFIAFSSNQIVQRFHSSSQKRIEVSDLASSLVLYDFEKNEMMEVDLPDKNQFMDTYPEWSPDGKYLYFCRADQIGEQYDYQDIKYNLYRVPFDTSSRSIGDVELVFDAAAENKSVSFPRVSPNGQSLVFTYHDYGCFPIWHKEADLYSIDLDLFTVKPLNVNSDFTDSYHSWSSNGNWLVFSSKRGDGLTARPYITYVDENGKEHKPFILPQKDPEFYNRFIRTFNRPEFATSKINLNPGKIRRIAKAAATQANWAQN